MTPTQVLERALKELDPQTAGAAWTARRLAEALADEAEVLLDAIYTASLGDSNDDELEAYRAFVAWFSALDRPLSVADFGLSTTAPATEPNVHGSFGCEAPGSVAGGAVEKPQIGE